MTNSTRLPAFWLALLAALCIATIAGIALSQGSKKASPPTITVAELIQNPTQYAGHRVTVHGWVSGVNEQYVCIADTLHATQEDGNMEVYDSAGHPLNAGTGDEVLIDAVYVCTYDFDYSTRQYYTKPADQFLRYITVQVLNH